MEEERDLFEGLGWEVKIVHQAELHICFNPLSEDR